MNKKQLPIPGLEQFFTGHKGPRDNSCYFYSNDRCLGKPVGTCNWSVKISEREWVCAYPWKAGGKNYA